MKIKEGHYTRLPQEILTRTSTPYPNFQQSIHEKPCQCCGSFITLYDAHRNESFCVDCGNVTHNYNTNLTEGNLIYGSYSREQSYTGTGYTRSERAFLERKHIHSRTFFHQSEQNHLDYTNFLYIIKPQLHLCRADVEDILNIIRTYDIHRLHTRWTYQQVILAITKYVLSRRNAKPYQLNLSNTVYRAYGMTRRGYEIVERNLQKKNKRRGKNI